MSPAVDTRLSPAAARLVRRVGFGLRPEQLGMLTSLDDRGVAERLLSAPTPPDPWGDTSYTVGPNDAGGTRRRTALAAIARWTDAIVATDAPLTDWLTWFWHGHFVSALPEVKNPQLMVDQLRLFRSLGRGGFGDLVTAVTTDPAMLLYLDGNDSTGAAPNENYSRELLELFTLGHGAYTEADIAAGARALSGWRVQRATGVASFVPRRHDDTPQPYLGVDGVDGVGGVHDVASVVAAIEAQPGLATTIAGHLARAVVGPAVDDDTVEAAATAFRSGDGSIEAALRTLCIVVADGVDGGGVVCPPYPWLVAALRSTGALLDPRAAFAQLNAAGQVPWFAPNVSGWPSGAAWDNASTVVARFTLAVGIAAATPADAQVLAAAGSSDPNDLGALLGLAATWSDSSLAALAAVTDARSRLALALTTPEFITV
ncbi:MAG: DUF1800 family protein [Actinobacteria bacterium]|nr:DUF1800 family protein [Actinomycetota bacterium]